ncbi:hypothetical protein AHiyo8_63700 [Arthrobacter sp. Hiyo8]|nr:hypothetical protein AHiyo8_63700 [Arthrobacter sp. Hiyo8]
MNLVGDGGEVVTRRGNIHHHEPGAVPVQRPCDRRADPTGGSRHDGDLPGQGLSGSAESWPAPEVTVRN